MPEYIERDALVKRIVDEQAENHVGCGNAGYKIGYHNGLSMARAMVLNAPAADVEPVKHGRWERVPSNGIGGTARCSICGKAIYGYYTMNYCPNCGAKMD